MALARRTKADLIAEVLAGSQEWTEQQLGDMAKQQLENILMQLRSGSTVVLPQWDVMLAASGEKYMDMEAGRPYVALPQWADNRYMVEEKLDGARAKLHLCVVNGERVVRIDGRNKSTATYAFSEFTAKLPHLRDFEWDPALFAPDDDGEGTVIDGELLMPCERLFTGKVTTDSVRYSSIVVLNAGVDVSLEIQRNNGVCLFYPFDVIMFKGKLQVQKPLEERLGVLSKWFSLGVPDAVRYVNQLPAAASAASKVQFYENIVKNGGEGVILKNTQAHYELGKRRESWLKVKKFQTIDCFVTGYRPGSHGFEGMVGALECCVFDEAGNSTPMCAVSGFTLEERKVMSLPDGSLNPLYLNKVMEVRFQEESKTGRGMHARFIRWRSDKSRESCFMSAKRI